MPYLFNLNRSGLGLAVVGTLVGRSRYLKTLDGQLIQAGLHVVVSTHSETLVHSALTQMIEPLKIDQASHLDDLARMDRGAHQEMLVRIKQQYCEYRKREILPDPDHESYFTRKIARLENALFPLTLMENPLPGRLVLASSKRGGGSRILATYEDRAFSGLLDAARTSRGILDLELLTKSWRQQHFDGAFLENLQREPIATGPISAIILLRPETAERFLLSSEPLVAGLADCCWSLTAARPLSLLRTGVTNPMAWQRVIARLRNLGSRGSFVRMSKEAGEAFAMFGDRLANALRQERTMNTGFLGQLPRLGSKIGLNLHLAQSEIPTFITGAQAQQAIGFSEASSRQRQADFQAWLSARAERQFQHLAERVMDKIRVLGPIGFRALCHAFDDQRSTLLLPVVNHLLQADRILKLADGRFDTPDRWLKRLRVEVC